MTETTTARTARIKGMQRTIQPFYPAAVRAEAVDGFWGPLSIKACQAYLKSLMPNPVTWPAPTTAALTAFYGPPGESRLVNITPPYPMLYDGQRIRTMRVHERCAESLLRVLKGIKEQLPAHPDIQDEAEDYGGCYAYRNKRGGSTRSLHAWGAAIDLDADDNTMRDHWPMQADMPLEIMAEFAREGWVAAGAFWGYDSMHFQATRLL